MNILITGLQATGKSTMGKALKMYYEAQGDDAILYDDGENATDSEVKGMAMQREAANRIFTTQHKPHNHTIVVSQLPSDRRMLDYVYQCHRLSGAR